MKPGDPVVLTENTIVVDAWGADYLLKGTKGVFKEERGEMLIMETAKGTYDIPAASIKAIPEDAAA